LTATCIEVKEQTELCIWGNKRIITDGIASDRKFSAENELKYAIQERVGTNRKHCLMMESGNFWTVGPNALKSKK
jgi:hypothetical protein